MTPHRHWFFTYEPHSVRVYLAEHTYIMSAGIGSVHFMPDSENDTGGVVEFSRVLHVPRLQSDLLSVLHLTREKDFIVTIKSNQLFFHCHDHLLFMATVNKRNTGYLDGTTLENQHAAQPVSILLLNHDLWHRRFGHLSIDAMKLLHRWNLVNGMKITSSLTTDPICKPCLAGKLHRGPIPKVAEFRATHPLQLVHADLHGPMTQSCDGYKYWATFTDDYRRVRASIKLKKKSNFYQAFRIWRPWAEKQTGCALVAMKEDKGGGFISNALKQLCKEFGIQCQHTVRAEPHQNGVAERANCNISDHVTAMLYESNLPPSF